jgi:hypothetical protein
LNQQKPADYILEHKILKEMGNCSIDEMTDQVSSLLNASIEFAQFLINTDRFSKKDDPFLVGLKRMIDDEKEKCSNNNSKLILNQQLLNELNKLKNEYERRMNAMKSNQNDIDLSVIYERIKITRNYPGVDEQMTTIKQSQQNLMKYYEYTVPDYLLDTSDTQITSF